MSQHDGRGQRGGQVTAQQLEERINMYIGAMDRANAMNDGHQSSQLQRDIQKLVDLMEKVSAGQPVQEREVPPPLVITPQTDILANPLGELSSRLADYHKALYFAEEELSDDRIHKIQRLQKGLQTIHGLQKRAQAGFPVRDDEIPPPVIIPSDDEFDNDAVNTLNKRYSQYQAALTEAEKADDRRMIRKIQSTMRTIEFLQTRAKARRPVWKKDIPPEFEYYSLDVKKAQKAKLAEQVKSLISRAQSISFTDPDQQKNVDEVIKKLQGHQERLSQASATDPSAALQFLTQSIEMLEKLADSEKMTNTARTADDLALIEKRLEEYKAAALDCKKNNQMNHLIQHFKVVKGLGALKEKLEKGEAVDMTLLHALTSEPPVVPPPPREFTPTSETPPFFADQEQQLMSRPSGETSQAVTANVTSVNIRPAVETAEDKLAKKLSSFLDDGATENMLTSEQLSRIHNATVTSVAATQLVPKVQNSDRGKNSVGEASNTQVPSSNQINSQPSGNETNQTTTTTNKNEVKDSISEVMKNDVRTSTIPSGSDAATADYVQGKLKVDSVSQANALNSDESGLDKEAKEVELDSRKEEISSPVLAKAAPTPSKASDIYNRKTLDSVGFLSCQNVSDQLYAKHQPPPVTSNMSQPTKYSTEEYNIANIMGPRDDQAHSKEQQTMSDISHSDDVIIHKESTTQGEILGPVPVATALSSNFDAQLAETVGESQHVAHGGPNAIPSLTSETGTDNTLVSNEADIAVPHEMAVNREPGLPEARTIILTSTAWQEWPGTPQVSQETDNVIILGDTEGPVSGEPHGSQALSDLIPNAHHYDSHTIPSSITLPAQGTQKLISQDESGPSSLPAAFPTQPSAHIPVLDQLSKAPKAGDLASTGQLEDTADVGRNVSQNSRAEYALDTPVQTMVDHLVTTTNSSMTDDIADSLAATNSTDTLEFQELMDSMSMPVISETYSSLSEPAVSQSGALIVVTQSSSNTMPEENAQLNYSHANSISAALPAVSSSNKSVVQSVSQSNDLLVKNDTERINSQNAYEDDIIFLSSNQPYLHKPVSNTMQDAQNQRMLTTNFSVMSSSSEQSQQQFGTTAQSSVLYLQSDGELNNSTDLPYNGHSTGQQPQLPDSFSLPPRTGQSWDSLPTLSGTYKSESNGVEVVILGQAPAADDVSFTCVENLKYEMLINMAKGTMESQEEIKKLQQSFDAITAKLRQGGRQIWEVYKTTVEQEVASMNRQLENLRVQQQWNNVKCLSLKKTLAERELTVLRERLPTLKY